MLGRTGARKAKKQDKAKLDKAKLDGPNVAQGSCERWCFLTETPFASMEEAADKEYQCRICVNANEMKGMLEMMRGNMGRSGRHKRGRGEGLREEKGKNKGAVGGELGRQRTHM